MASQLSSRYSFSHLAVLQLEHRPMQATSAQETHCQSPESFPQASGRQSYVLGAARPAAAVCSVPADPGDAHLPAAHPAAAFLAAAKLEIACTVAACSCSCTQHPHQLCCDPARLIQEVGAAGARKMRMAESAALGPAAGQNHLHEQHLGASAAASAAAGGTGQVAD